MILETVMQIVMNPYMLPVLLSLGLIGMAVEFLVPGFGVPGIVGIISFVLYFSGQFYAGFADPLHILLFIGGILLLLVEVFVPAFGIIGGVGIICIFAGIVLAAESTWFGIISLGIAVMFTILVVVVLIKYFGHVGVWNRFILREQQKNEQGYEASPVRTSLIGKQGVAITPLRPAGTAKIEGKLVDVVSVGLYIEKGTMLQIVDVQGSRVIVEEII